MFCNDYQCSGFDYFNYSIQNFNKNLTIIQDGKECSLVESSFSKFFDLSSSVERYNVTYECFSNINSLNLKNNLFYEKTGYYFEQYYVVNCTNSVKVIYTDMTLPEIEYNYSKICGINPGKINFDSINLQEELNETKIQENSNIFNKVIELSKKKEYFFLFLIFSFFLGVLHSFSPGHGKSLIVSYIIGKKVSNKDILILSLTTATTHVLDVLLLSFVFLFLPLSLKNEYMNYITIFAALLIIMFGINFFLKNISKNKAHTHHHHGHSHEHPHKHPHEHTHLHTYENDHMHNHEHDPSHHHKSEKKNLFSIGILAGLAPCPTAWLLFSILISLNLYYQALFSLLFFSLGLISTILAISFLFLHFKKAFNFIPEEFKGYNILKLISSILIILIGVIMLLRITL